MLEVVSCGSREREIKEILGPQLVTYLGFVSVVSEDLKGSYGISQDIGWTGEVSGGDDLANLTGAQRNEAAI